MIEPGDLFMQDVDDPLVLRLELSLSFNVLLHWSDGLHIGNFRLSNNWRRDTGWGECIKAIEI